MRRLHIPAFLNYECQACGRCCHDYEVTLTDAEFKRLDAADWARVYPQLAGKTLFEASHGRGAAGPRRFCFDAERGCVFLDDDGRCLVHEHLGLERKALACRLFPFTFAETPSGVYVGGRFNCWAMVRGEGERMQRQQPALHELYQTVARAGQPEAFGETIDFDGRQTLDWADYLKLERALINLLLRPDYTLPWKVQAFWEALSLMREAQMSNVAGARFEEFVTLLTEGLVGHSLRRPTPPGRPGPVARAFWRQFVFLLHSRTDAAFSRLSLSGRLAERIGSGWTAVEFLLGRGRACLHGGEDDFAIARVGRVALPSLGPEVSGMIERYLAAKLFGKQVFGPMFFNYNLLHGCAFLVCAYAAILWFARAFALGRDDDQATADDIAAAIGYVDFTFGYSDFPAVGSERIRVGLLARGLTPARLAAAQSREWYAEDEAG